MAVATLHAESWRAFYRGAYQDEYLDGDIVEDRLRVWEERLLTPAPDQFVVLAEEDDELIGFACAYGGHDDTWGSFLDNIHVRPEYQRRGVGARIMAEVAAWCRANYTDCGLHLWVLGAESWGTTFLPAPRRQQSGREHLVPTRRRTDPTGAATRGKRSRTSRGRERVGLHVLREPALCSRQSPSNVRASMTHLPHR
jgi:GNAT superfamily N-acetyltransferase